MNEYDQTDLMQAFIAGVEMARGESDLGFSAWLEEYEKNKGSNVFHMEDYCPV